MYIPASFAETRVDVLHESIRRHPFATLVTTGPTGEPFATHLPLLLKVDANHPLGVLVGHVARGNDHADLLREGLPTLAIFHGPHAYVSPRWYATAPSVPTWNYLAVHAYGEARIIDQPGEVRTLLQELVEMFEPTERGWSISGLSEPYLNSMTAGIVAFELRITRLEGKAKLSQNRVANDRAGVISALSSGTDEEMAVAELMRSHTPEPREILNRSDVPH